MSTDSSPRIYCSHLLKYKDPEKRLQKIREWKQNNLENIRQSNLRGNLLVKIEALSRYGKDGKAVCCWDGCQISDLDMLTLDHINNDGAQHRETRKGRTGVDMYRKMRLKGWPDGFQTLCWNHQWKKEIQKRRDRRIVYE